MPIKWTAEAEHQLLLLILKVQNRPLTTDAKAIADAWQGSEKPSARAIIERIAKLKKQIGVVGNGNSPQTPSSTPTKRQATPRQTPGSSKKVRRTRDKLGDEDTDDSEPDLGAGQASTTPTRPPVRRSVAREGQEHQKNAIMIDSDIDGGADSDMSEYHAVKTESLFEEKLREVDIVVD